VDGKKFPFRMNKFINCLHYSIFLVLFLFYFEFHARRANIFVGGCLTVELTSEKLGNVLFEALPIVLRNGEILEDQSISGRQVFVSRSNEVINLSRNLKLYLYHKSTEIETGIGRWYVGEDWKETKNPIAYIGSWSVTPYATSYVNEMHKWWMVWNEESAEWEQDTTLKVVCSPNERDGTIFFESSNTYAPDLSGFFVQRSYSIDGILSENFLFSLVTSFDQSPKYLFEYDDKVMISDQIGIDLCFAFIEDLPRGKKPQEIGSALWYFGVDNSWKQDVAHLYSYSTLSEHNETPMHNIYEIIRKKRVVSVPPEQQVYSLRNTLTIPALGLGTGGLYLEEVESVVKLSLGIGYRLFDLAREYENEHLIGKLLKYQFQKGLMRKDIFLETKVWPTHLGFGPTSAEISESLLQLGTSYIDLYLLHWPYCDSSIDWMHCEDTVDANGTWQQSWMALERAYAEGRVMSIGVSNFNKALLETLETFATILPHVVQNWAEPGSLDLDVRAWCQTHNVIYQPYASLRNLEFVSPDIQNTLQVIASQRHLSVHNVVLRFFIQTGSAVIPRSRNKNHLLENMNVFSWELDPDEMRSLGWNVSSLVSSFNDEL